MLRIGRFEEKGHNLEVNPVYDALKVEFKPEHRLVICRPQGVVDDFFAIQLLNFLLALEEVAEPFNRLLDLTHATDIPLTSKMIQEYAEARSQATAHLEPFCTAIIGSRPEAETVARLYASTMADSKIAVGVFPDTSSAAQWLKLPEEILLSPAIPIPQAKSANALPRRPQAT
jgi:hypothetical protein